MQERVGQLDGLEVPRKFLLMLVAEAEVEAFVAKFPEMKKARLSLHHSHQVAESSLFHLSSFRLQINLSIVA